MPDIIRLLPDSVANQIAAGEVIQRPASAVKELLENAVDAGAINITLIVKDAGKSLIQVVDNGSGMSYSDARMSFERHATSKISLAEDLFKIRSKGFRGEALASIAAIAQVEVKTRKPEEETGTLVTIEGSTVSQHEITACNAGTSVSVKNLFFNIPARRNFLKSNASETKHILDEFNRVALAHPEIAMSLVQDGLEVFRLQSGNLRQRITALMGNNYNERLVPVQEETTIVSVEGFIGKPEFARKSRGEQFFFVNRRYIRDAYLNHAVVNAFEGLLPQGCFPSYFIMINIDPSKIDVNIHPTKTEIKFDDERAIYSIIRASVKRALGKFAVAPSLDFDQEHAFSIPVSMYSKPPSAPKINVNPGYNPFKESAHNPAPSSQAGRSQLFEMRQDEDISRLKVAGQIGLSFILCFNDKEAILIDQQSAHERILYEEFKVRFEKSQSVSQQDLFPVVMEFSHSDFEQIRELMPDLRKSGFDMDEFGRNTVVISGLPPGVNKGSEKRIIEEILEGFKNNVPGNDINPREKLLRSLVTAIAVKSGQKLDEREMQLIADKLRHCSQPNFNFTGKATFVTLAPDVVANLFKQRSLK